MTAAPVQIVGFLASSKVPGFIGEVRYGQGPVSASDLPTYVLCVGYMLAGGLATANQSLVNIRSSDDADAWFGAGSEVARMCYQALRVPGVSLKAMGISDPVGASAATATLTVTATLAPGATVPGWVTAGSWNLRIDGETYTGGIVRTDTPATVAASIVAVVNGRAQCPVTASAPTGSAVVTFTRKNVGDRGNQGSLYQVTDRLPRGCTLTLASASTTVLPVGGVRFGGGAGVEDASLAVAALEGGQHEYTALATNDLTAIVGVGHWQESVARKAGPLEGRAGFVVIGMVDDPTHASGLGTQVNDVLWQLVFLQDGECPPSEIAARMAAERQVREAGDPAASYDDVVLDGLPPQVASSSRPSRSTKEALLGTGVTPLTTTPDGRVQVVRSITSHCLNGAQWDYRTLDTSEEVVPQFIRKDIGLLWATSYRVANPRVSDDPPNGQPAPRGVATPQQWNSYVTVLLKRHEAGFLGGPPIVINVDQNLPTSGYLKEGRRIMTIAPVVPAPANHSVGVSIQQIAA